MTENKATNQRTMVGRVTSNKMDKTIVVLVERRVQHAVYKKIIKSSKNLWMVHSLMDNLLRPLLAG